VRTGDDALLLKPVAEVRRTQANESAREQLISTKAVYPNPSINLLALLWEFLGCNSPATEVCAVGTLCNLAENLDVRPRRHPSPSLL
jgi:hypothetical protein